MYDIKSLQTALQMAGTALTQLFDYPVKGVCVRRLLDVIEELEYRIDRAREAEERDEDYVPL